MTALIPAALYGWTLVMVAMFFALPPRRALVWGMTAGWLLLPVQTLRMQGFVDIDRRWAISLAAVVAAGLADGGRLLRFRPRLLDLPMLLYCTSGIFSALTNGLGLYDGLTSSLRITMHWGVPWFLGRVYLCDPEGLRELCKAVFLGGLAYAPLCLWEVRMSPILHSLVYGVEVYGGISYASDLGAWGSRPSVFLANPLELGLFMTTAGLAGVTLSRLPREERIMGLRTTWLTVSLVMVAILCKNLGATALLAVGVAAFYFTRRFKAKSAFLFLAAVTPLYSLVRVSGVWDGEEVVQVASAVHHEKGISFAFRLHNEDRLLEKAMQRPLFGWGGWGRSRVYDEYGADTTIQDGMWIIALGMTGLWGLTTILLALTIPILLCMQTIPRTLLAHNRLAPMLFAAAVVAIQSIDFIANNFPSPIALLAAGGVVGIRVARAGAGRSRVPRPD